MILNTGNIKLIFSGSSLPDSTHFFFVFALEEFAKIASDPLITKRLACFVNYNLIFVNCFKWPAIAETKCALRERIMFIL